jgi:hypothetical protein
MRAYPTALIHPWFSELIDLEICGGSGFLDSGIG